MGGSEEDAKDIFQDGLSILILMADDPEFNEISDWVHFEELYWNIFKSLLLTCRSILLLYFKEFSNSKIASILNVKVGYIKKRKSLCKQLFIERITSHSDFHRLRGTEIESRKN